jgi:hypothetical protein
MNLKSLLKLSTTKFVIRQIIDRAIIHIRRKLSWPYISEERNKLKSKHDLLIGKKALFISIDESIEH